MLVVLFGLGMSGVPLTADVPDYSEGRPDERHRTQHEDAVQNSHRGEDNKLTFSVQKSQRTASRRPANCEGNTGQKRV
jgi:hypothetical protein